MKFIRHQIGTIESGGSRASEIAGARGGIVSRIALAAGLGLALLPSPATAGSLSSAFVVSNDTSSVACHVSNVDVRPVTITSAKVLDLSGNDITTSETCGTLAPGRTCLIIAIVASGDGGRGVVEVAGSTKKLRAACLLLNRAGVLLDAIEMR